MKQLLSLMLLLPLAVGACQTTPDSEITEARAIELARPHVTFEPDSAEAEKGTEAGQPVWRVTFRRQAGLHPMGNVMIVTIDRDTGAIVALARG